mmetsp:Transcript_6605/g.17276  ORF Transcript_6605/g.17276 Transcript_6605/m.17276 type:complete len:123 (+) Transcript_6605:327-695(+)
MMTAAASERGKRLATKAQQGRSTASIDKLLPAGTVSLDKIPERGGFDVGAAGDAAWAARGRRRRDRRLCALPAAGVDGARARVLEFLCTVGVFVAWVTSNLIPPPLDVYADRGGEAETTLNG